MKSFDYIIVGAGSAGCVLANRLSADPSARVLLVEAGGRDRHPLLRVPLACGLFFYNPSMTWGYESEPEPHAHNRRLMTPAGRLLGGGSSINGMIYTRGHPRDFDQWAQMGNPGWSYDDVLPYFRQSENNWRGASAYHGASGPLSVEKNEPDAMFAAIAATARKLGHGVTADFDGDTPEGVGMADATTSRGRRGSTARRYLRPVARRSNLELLMSVQVNRVILEGDRAVGIEYVEMGVRKEARADREVILSAGAFGTPKLLMLSGIGSAEELRALGIEVRHDAPDVGENLQDHPGVDLQFRAADPPTPFDERLRLDRLSLGMLKWAVTGKGGPQTLACTALGFLRSREGLDRPDIEWVFFGAYADTRVWFPGWRSHAGGTVGLQTILLRPESRGSVKLRSADPAEKPRIRLNIFATENDRQTVLRGLRMSREFMATDPARRLVKGELAPGVDVGTDEALLAYMRGRVYSNIHYAGTCRMGSDARAVVDPELRVRGISRLRVADASIMPMIVGAHTNAATIMIAEKAADLIIGRSANCGDRQKPVH